MKSSVNILLCAKVETLKVNIGNVYICATENMAKLLCPGLRHMCTLKDSLQWHAKEVKMEKTYIFYKIQKI